MNEPFLEFEWRVAERYEWKDWLDEDGQPVVVPANGLASLQSCSAVELASERLGDTGPVLAEVGDGSAARMYRPMQREHAGLAFEFAGLDYRDRPAIQAFAAKFGLLGVPPQAQLVDGREAVGESHLAWAREICRVRTAVQLLGRRQHSGDKAPVADGRHHRIDLEEGATLAPPVGGHTQALRDREKLSWLFDVQLQGTRARIGLDPDGRARLQLAPRTLLAAIWLQLALAVAGGKQFVQCKFCSRFMEISTEQTGFRTHREFCSGTCKTNDYRRRKRAVAELAGRKLPVKEIISRVAASPMIATDPATVRGWIAEARKRKRASRTKGGR